MDYTMLVTSGSTYANGCVKENAPSIHTFLNMKEDSVVVERTPTLVSSCAKSESWTLRRGGWSTHETSLLR